MKRILVLLLFVALPLTAGERVLLVASNDAFDLGELAQAHALFTFNDFAVDIATPSGGEARPKEYDDDSAVIETFLREHRGKLARTVAIAEVDTTRYAALFLVGGSGAMFEFPSHAALRQQLAAMADRGAVIGAVCHGPAALRDVTLADGRALVAGRRISAFTDEEEARFGGKVASTYPFALEQALRERGALFEEGPLMLVQVSRDGLLVTGQNPFSTPRAVDEVVRALGRTPKPRRIEREEATMLLIAELLRDAAARAKLDAAPGDYDPKLLAMYGAMLADGATDDAELRRAVLLLDAAARHIDHPKVKSALDRARVRLGEREKNNHEPAEAARPADRRPE